MTLSSLKGLPVIAFPSSRSSIVVAVAGLAFFLVFASWVLISYPIGTTFQDYFQGGQSKKLDVSVVDSKMSLTNGHPDVKDAAESSEGNGAVKEQQDVKVAAGSGEENGGAKQRQDLNVAPGSVQGNGGAPSESFDAKSQANDSENIKIIPPSLGVLNDSRRDDLGESGTYLGSHLNSTETNSKTTSNKQPEKIESGSCDLYQGKWVYDPIGPLYTNNTCPIITQMQNCQGNGRPDKEYENYRWKPEKCVLPRFDAKKFMELMRGKTLAFVGDSVARNQMESLMCILWQVETPINRGNRKMHRWFFKSFSLMIVRIWSSWLVHTTREPFVSATKGVDKLHLDIPDEIFMDSLLTFDVLVLSSGHWFAKPSVYIVNNEIVGWQLWKPEDKTLQRKIGSAEAFGISVKTVLNAIATHPNYTGLTIVRSYSPDHYEGGAWNTGGSCTGKIKPATESEIVANAFTDQMYAKQVEGFQTEIKKVKNPSKLKLMDITKPFNYRSDGHPGPYRSLDPNKITKRGPNGEPPPQDCLHWCMPGPVDTWNEFVLEIMCRDSEGV